MAQYLIGIMFHEPKPFALWNSGIVEDYESTTGLFIEAVSPEAALAWGEQVGPALLKFVNGDDALDWKGFGHYCWLEALPTRSQWAHCLDFFQHVRDGHMPDFNLMTSSAYGCWQNQNLKP